MAKRKVRCEFCGFEWETQSPFEKFMCPSCHKQTKAVSVKE